MNDLLLVMLSIIGMLAFYWVLFGQWKHNKMMMQARIEEMKREQEKQEKEKITKEN